MFIKILRFIASILLIPACVAVTINFYNGIASIKYISEAGFVFILGALCYSLLHLLLFKLDFLYVLSHELLHAIAALFSGGKVVRIEISRKEGSVKTTTPNLLVALAPYLIPGYTVFLALFYFILSFFVDVLRYSGYFIFFTGFTLMFHLTYTADSIRQKQSDLMKTGYFFSIFFIYIINLLLVFFIVSLLFKEISFVDFIKVSLETSETFYYSFWKQLFL